MQHLMFRDVLESIIDISVCETQMANLEKENADLRQRVFGLEAELRVTEAKKEKLRDLWLEAVRVTDCAVRRAEAVVSEQGSSRFLFHQLCCCSVFCDMLSCKSFCRIYLICQGGL
jgi:hypothetical protein